MGLLRRLLPYLPSYKWCGCEQGVTDEHEYQFRVRVKEARTDNEHPHIFQIRRRSTCSSCGDETADVIFERGCMYYAERDQHERKVGKNDRTMESYGFVEYDEIVRMLAEMRLVESFEPALPRSKDLSTYST